MATNEETANQLINLADQLLNRARELLEEEKKSKSSMTATAIVVSAEASVSPTLQRNYIRLGLTIPLYVAVAPDSPKHYELEQATGFKVDRESLRSLESLKGRRLEVLLSFEKYRDCSYLRIKRFLPLEKG